MYNCDYIILKPKIKYYNNNKDISLERRGFTIE